MPKTPDYPCKVINGESGHSVENSSWILGRLVRDFYVWRDETTAQSRSQLLEAKWAELKQSDPGATRPVRTGLIASIYAPSRNRRSGVPRRDIVYWTGLGTILVQLGISIIPITNERDWAILILTIEGTILAILTSLLPQWQSEKWGCRTHSNDTYVVTGGKGSQNAIVILANGHGLNLEDLAAGHKRMGMTTIMSTRVAIVALSALWICFLISAAGVGDNAWLMLVVGAVGIFHNIIVAGAARRPESHGIHLDFVEVTGATSVMKTLTTIEMKYPRLGRSMLSEFFPDQLSEDGIQLWDSLEKRAGSSETLSCQAARTHSEPSAFK